MIPFVQYTDIIIGPISIKVWGLLVSGGILAAILHFYYRAKRGVLSTALVLDLSVAVVIGALIGGRLGHILCYQPAYYLAHPAEIIAFWHGGASSLGGFIGGSLTAAWFFWRRKFSWSEVIPYLDIGTLSLWLGWGVGRIGCFLIHDHPGTLTSFIGGVNYPGGIRHDLGLYESLTGFALFIVFSLLFTALTKRRPGLVTYFSVLAYAIARFFLDFLRAHDLPISDVRYWILTPAQWGMLLFVAALTFIPIYGKIKRSPKMLGTPPSRQK